MNVRTTFDSIQDLTVENYFKSKGIEDAEAYLAGDGSITIPDYPKTKKFFLDNVENRKCVVVVDPDVDGYTSSAIMCKYLEWCGVDYVPAHHIEKSHGIEDLINDLPNDCFLIVPDASIKNELIPVLDEKNIKSIVLDHHLQQEGVNDCLEKNHAIITNGEVSQSGSVVTWKFIESINPVAEEWMDLAIIGNIADTMDMSLMESRAILCSAELNNEFVKNILQLEKLEFIPNDLSYNVINRMNAVCRSTDVELKNDMLCQMIKCTDEWQDVWERMKKKHQQQNYQIKTYEQKTDRKDFGGVVFIPAPKIDGFTSIGGLVCNKVMSKENKPVLSFTEHNGELSGSVRSPYPLLTGLKESGLVSFVAGHESAFGYTFDTDKLDDVVSFINDYEYDTTKEVTISLAPREVPYSLFRDFGGKTDVWCKGIESPTIYIRPFTINLKEFQFINRYKTSARVTLNGNRCKFAMQIDYLSKVRRIEMQLGENVLARVSAICEPKQVKSGEQTFNVLQIKELNVEPIEDDEDF